LLRTGDRARRPVSRARKEIRPNPVRPDTCWPFRLVYRHGIDEPHALSEQVWQNNRSPARWTRSRIAANWNVGDDGKPWSRFNDARGRMALSGREAAEAATRGAKAVRDEAVEVAATASEPPAPGRGRCKSR
jgi:hypothetical protein